ncbi:hypothetical protein [Oceanobacter mangrovi]|uniref:hypothetical protein n=1 Tax=Oceanobacter mangrovi TaxID=2862510 RepID=UPI001C8D0EB0|nr:hypothetical protein [Oceanobacter mangrovi]
MARQKNSKQRTVAETTLLVVGEGADDKAFITHMKGLFYQRQPGQKGPKIEAGDGGSADVIITNSLRTFRNAAYNRKLLVLDSDLPPSLAKARKAEEAGFEIILWAPQCLEGALLDVLGETVNSHETSQNLKARLHPQLADHHTKPEAYGVLFTKPVLDNTQNASIIAVKDAVKYVTAS